MFHMLIPSGRFDNFANIHPNIVYMLSHCRLVVRLFELSIIFRFVSHLGLSILERAMTFNPVFAYNGTFLCATTTPNASFPVGAISGMPTEVSGAAQCAICCQNYDGCRSFNFVNGTQCHLYTSPPTKCIKMADDIGLESPETCQHYQVVLISSWLFVALYVFVRLG